MLGAVLPLSFLQILLQRFLTKKYSALQTAAYSIIFWNADAGHFRAGSRFTGAAAPFIAMVYVAVSGCFRQRYRLCCLDESVRKGPEDLVGEQLYVYYAFFSRHIGVFSRRGTPGQGHRGWRGIILIGVFLFIFGSDILARFKRKKTRPAERV
jgi:hypothetical protein